MKIDKPALDIEEQKSSGTKIKDKINEDVMFSKLKKAIDEPDDELLMDYSKILKVENENKELKKQLKQSEDKNQLLRT